MDRERIYSKLEDLLSNPKSKNFLNHLIKSYLPVNKTQKVWDKPEGKFKCVLTNVPLISVNEALEGINTEEFKKDFFKHLKSFASEDQREESPIKKMLNGRVLAFSAKKTDTFMSQEAFQAFYDWVVMKMLSGDKHINWVIRSMNKEKFLDRAEVVVTDETRESLDNIREVINNAKMATTSLGEFDALKDLKAKMEAEERNN